MDLRTGKEVHEASFPTCKSDHHGLNSEVPAFSPIPLQFSSLLKSLRYDTINSREDGNKLTRSTLESTRVAPPTFLSLRDFAAARATEISHFISALKGTSNGLAVTKKSKRAFQRLRKCDRRRAMSFNPYKIPKRCRFPVIKDMLQNPPKESRRVRKDRRRPHDLNSIYQNRSRKHQWLETHIWHAKRFHMQNLWNFRLAESPVERCQRKLYRYAARHCVIHDRSYMRLIELKGDLQTLQEVLLLCGANVTHIFHPLYLSGSASGSTSFYAPVTHEKDPQTVQPTQIHDNFSFYYTEKTGETTEAISHPVFEFVCTAQFLWSASSEAELQYTHSTHAFLSTSTSSSAVREDSAEMQPCDPLPASTLPPQAMLWLWIHPSAIETMLNLLEEARQSLTRRIALPCLLSFQVVRRKI
ncbi:POPLD (NUC188) domain-containing protein [Cardiosporidium cionae]|uniref:POPLD (NUC188) domain-containing protein n=1 Tax=Cardiosporidium cionae TaxID=476202 RepID=A0ABQ7JB54_9APIC|nr:POPLD (NUC188) domain-containing protein [Cardiosporidium cionae]|eukprot:KAF8820885.1 POPLD (NUC188) domain-containing protein [Cardiosporidium cionae]